MRGCKPVVDSRLRSNCLKLKKLNACDARLMGARIAPFIPHTSLDAFPVLARGGGRWGRARSAGHQASRASPAPRAALIPARRAPERARASRARRGDLLPVGLAPIVTVHGCAALVAARCPRGRDAAGCGRCAMVVVLSRPLRSPERNGRAIRSRFHHLEVSCSSLAFY